MSGLGATAAAGVGSKYLGSPVGDADALAFTTAAIGAGIIAAAAGGIAVGATFGGPDDSEVAGALDWQSHVQEFTRAREDELMLEQTLASLKRDVQLVENKAREQAIFDIYEQGVDSGSEADATAAAEDAINDAYTTVEKSILTSWNIRLARADTMATNFGGSVFEDHKDGALVPDGDVVSGNEMDGRIGDAYTSSYTLLDGTTMDVRGENYTSSGESSWRNPTIKPDSVKVNQLAITKPDPANYDGTDLSEPDGPETAVVYDTSAWGEILIDLYDAHSTLMDEVSTMVSSYYQPAKDGEIDLYEAVGPKHLTETASTATDYQEAAMALRAMGYPMSEQVVTISVPKKDESGDLELTGVVFR